MLLLRGVYISGRWMRLINFRNVLISKYKGTDVYGRKGRRAERRTRDDWLSKIDSNTMNGLLSRPASVLFSALSPVLLQHHSYHLPACALRCPSVDRGWDIFPFDPRSVFSPCFLLRGKNCRPKLCAILNILINRTQHI